MADTDKTIKELPLTSNVNDEDDIIIEDDSPTTYRIKARDLKSYITNEVQTQVTGALAEIESNTNLITSLNSALAGKQNTLSSYQWNMVDNLTVAANSTSNVNYGFPDSTYTYLGVIGYRVYAASDNGSGHSNINVYDVRRLSNGIEFAVRNMSSSSDAKIAIQVYLLRTT